MTAPRFDVYGRFVVEVERAADGGWRVLELGADGKRRLRDDLVLQAELGEAELEAALDALLHELAQPGRQLRRVM